MTTLREGASTLAERAREAYNAAADTYDSLPFWDRFGARAVERLALPPGAHVLDVCAGTGACSLPAAERVGPSGSVLAVDLSERMLERAASKAAARRLAHLRIRAADMMSLGEAEASFDAVICGFGIYYLDDMAAGMKLLWSLLRPGGSMAVTAWAPRSFEPAESVFWDAVGKRRPELRGAFSPWDRITDADVFRLTFTQAGIPQVQVETEELDTPLPQPDGFWTIAMGTAFRWTIERLTPEEQQWLKGEVIARLASVTTIRFTAIFATARHTLPEPTPG